MRKALRLLALASVVGAAFATSVAAAELKVGDMAPNFTLQASDGKTYSLADFRGKQQVVLAWYPKAYTKGCTIECKSLAEHGDMIRAYDVKYFMASVDALDQNTKFADEMHADFPLLSDPTKKAADAYGVLNANGLANRWTFYIGRDGTIQFIEKAVKPDTSAEDMAAKLKELKVPAARRAATH